MIVPPDFSQFILPGQLTDTLEATGRHNGTVFAQACFRGKGAIVPQVHRVSHLLSHSHPVWFSSWASPSPSLQASPLALIALPLASTLVLAARLSFPSSL